MKTSLTTVLITIFFIIAAIHFYWMFGGKWGFSEVLPTTSEGMLLLNPQKRDSAIVGIGFLIFALFYLFKTDVFNFSFPTWLMKIGDWFIPLIFVFRAIGDFKYLGFFKQVSQTEFGQLDTLFYSPLCLLIGCIGLILIRIK